MDAAGRYRGRRRYEIPQPTPVPADPLRVRFAAALVLGVAVGIFVTVAIVRGLPPGTPETATPAARNLTALPRADAAAARAGPSVRTSTARSGGPAASGAPANPGTSTSPRPGRSPTEPPIPAVPPSYSPAPSPSPSTDSYEAEAGGNTLGAGVQVRVLDAASGHRFVGNVGNNASLRFNGVTAVNGGNYLMTVFYLSAAARSAWLKINNGDVQVVMFNPSGGADKIGALSMTVELVVGTNTVEFGQSSGTWAPDLDRITIR